MQFSAGDLIFFYGRDFTSRVIEWATRGPSHVGIVCPAEDCSTPVLFESTTLCDLPCLIARKRTSGVQAHRIETRVAIYEGSAYRMRLARPWRLYPHEVARLQQWLLQMIDEPYDLSGALLSGTRLFKWTALMPYPDLGSLFCSELCAAALMRMGRMPIRNPSLFNPAYLQRKLRRWGIYSAPELISPEAL
jgi:hypothetical protein